MRQITTLINGIPVLARVSRHRAWGIAARRLPRRSSGLPRHGRKVGPKTIKALLVVSTIGLLMLGSAPTWSGTLPSFPIDHFLLYKLKSPKGAPALVPPLGVELADQFETRDVMVAKEDLLGVPVDKNGEGTLDDLTHLVAYSTSDERGQAKHVRRTVSVTNQFGSVRVRTTVAKRLMVPASKGLADFLPAPDPLAHAVDHYRCYGVAVAKGERFQKIERVHVADQFQDKRIDVLKPFMLCNPAEKRWAGAVEPIRHADDHLLCYRVRASKSEPRHAPTNVFLTDQFGQLSRSTVKETELCVPSSTVILDPPTPTPSPTATPAGHCGDDVIDDPEQCDGATLGICGDLGVSCGEPGFSNECNCCSANGEMVTTVGCCNPSSVAISFGPAGGGQCTPLRCDAPFTCGSGAECLPSGDCCSLPGTPCRFTLTGQDLQPCCDGSVCERPDASGFFLSCCVPQAGACSQGQECCSGSCSAGGSCD